MRRRTWLVVLLLAIVVVGSTVGVTSALAHEPTVPDGSWQEAPGHCPGMPDGWNMGYHDMGLTGPVTLQSTTGG